MKKQSFSALSVAVFALSLTPAAVIAQEEPPAPMSAPPAMGDSVFDDTYVTVGLGGAIGPSYDGSDDYVLNVLPVINGAIDGIEFSPRGPGFAVDFIRDKDGAKVDYALGIVGTVNFDRNNQIKDSVVEALGERDVAVEFGPTAGVSFNQLLNPFDSLTVNADVKWDVAGAHNGMTISPGISYFTPVSRAVAVSLGISADYVDDDYSDYYFSIDSAGSTASGLPTFQADGGFNKAGVNSFVGVDLDGDITNGGFGLFAIGSYSRMLGDAKRSPVTSIRGSADQFFGVLGLGYTF